MRDYGLISTKMWTRGSGKRLRGNAVAMLVGCYLCTSPHSNMIGVYYCPLVTISHELGLPVESIREALKVVESEGFAFYDEDSEFVWVPNHAEIEIGDTLRPGDRRGKRIKAEFELIGCKRFAAAFLERYGSAFGLATATTQNETLQGHASLDRNVARSGSEHDQDINKAVGASDSANDSDPPKSERRPSSPPPAIPLRPAQDAFGATFLASAWCDGISAATGKPCTALDRFGLADLQNLTAAHAGGLTGSELVTWVRDIAKEYASSVDRNFWRPVPKRCSEWLDGGRPKRPEQQSDKVQKSDLETAPWRGNMRVTKL